MLKEKSCSTCKQVLEVSNFYSTSKLKSGYQSACKSCLKIQSRKKYLKNKQGALEHNYKNRSYLQTEINKLKLAPCKDCYTIYEPPCMDFDHIGPKQEAISRLIHNTWSLKRIKEEIKQTELVCIFCHKRRTWERIEAKEKKEPDHLLPRSIKRNLTLVRVAKTKPCAICNKQYPHYQMEFDHLSDKSFNISHVVRCGCRENLLRNEINKCQILCCLCHRRKTYNTWAFYKNKE